MGTRRAGYQALLTAAGLLPRSTLLGANLIRLPAAASARREIALTIDDGPDPGHPARSSTCAAGARASFFCIGHRARRFPALCRQIVARGHRVENHGDSHSLIFATFGMRRLRADIAAAQATLADITGQAPCSGDGRAAQPAADPGAGAARSTTRRWTRRAFDTREGDPQRVHQRLTRGFGPGDILLLHDGNAARSPAGEAVLLTVLPRMRKPSPEIALNPSRWLLP